MRKRNSLIKKREIKISRTNHSSSSSSSMYSQETKLGRTMTVKKISRIDRSSSSSSSI